MLALISLVLVSDVSIRRPRRRHLCASASPPLVSGERCREPIEEAEILPELSIADDVKPSFGPGDRYVEQVRAFGRPLPRAGTLRGAPQHEDDDVGFLALHGVHGPHVALRELRADVRAEPALGSSDDVAERADHPDVIQVDFLRHQLLEESGKRVSLIANPMAGGDLTSDIDPAVLVRELASVLGSVDHERSTVGDVV